MTTYTLLVEHNDGIVRLASDKEGKHLVAAEKNQYLLREVGDSLLKNNLALSYQLAILSGYPARKEDLAA